MTIYTTYMPALNRAGWYKFFFLEMMHAPEDIGDDTPLFSPEGLALDSIDALELAVGIEKNFGVATPNAEVAREAFVSVNTIAAYIIAKKA